MKKDRFNGPMGQRIKQHLELRHSLGFIYKTAKYTLDSFDRQLAKYFPDCKTISREMITSYLGSIRNLKSTTQALQLGSLRQFCRFMFQFNLNTYIPEKGLIGPATVQVKPYIFTEEEIIKLIIERQ